MTTKPNITLTQLVTRFATEEACKQYLQVKRWPKGVRCPRCQNEKVYALKARPFHWVCKCKKCGGQNGYRFSILTRTVFENTNYPLRTWFQVIYLMTQSKKGISAMQIHRQIGSGDYRTAWYMCHRIRAAMKNQTFRKLTGVVEVDETFIGGKDKNRHKDKRQHLSGVQGKVAIIGAISRKGNVTAKVIENIAGPVLDSFVRQTVSERVNLVATDEHTGYDTLDRRGVPHQACSHSSGQYVRGEVHTNNIESFWSLVKRGVMGTFHNISKDYLPLYLAEFTFRHNQRKNPDIFGAVVAGC